MYCMKLLLIRSHGCVVFLCVTTPQFTFSILLLMGIWVIPSYDYYGECCYEHSNIFSFGNISTHFCWVEY